MRCGAGGDKVYEDENLVERAAEMGRYMEERVEEMKKTPV